MSNITSADAAKNQAIEQETFANTWRIINLIFTDSSETKLNVYDSWFYRGLLTFGDYSIWANSTYTLFFEGGKGYFNWRRMLRESSSLAVFKLLFDKLNVNSVTSASEVETILRSAIDSYNDMSDDLRYYFIKIHKAFEFMREKRFRKTDGDIYNGRNLLYRRARLSADYAEAYSFFVYCLVEGDKEYHYGRGYLDSPTTDAYIEKVNGTNCYITFDYNNKCFVDKNKVAYTDECGNPIKTVDGMVNHLKCGKHL